MHPPRSESVDLFLKQLVQAIPRMFVIHFELFPELFLAKDANHLGKPQPEDDGIGQRLELYIG